MKNTKDFYKNLGPAFQKTGRAGKYYSIRLTFEGVDWLIHVKKAFEKQGGAAKMGPSFGGSRLILQKNEGVSWMEGSATVQKKH